MVLGSASIDARTSDRQTPLYLASRLGHVAIVKFLLSEGADVNAPTDFGWTPLFVAAHEGWEDVVKYIMVWKERQMKRRDLMVAPGEKGRKPKRAPEPGRIKQDPEGIQLVAESGPPTTAARIVQIEK